MKTWQQASTYLNLNLCIIIINTHSDHQISHPFPACPKIKFLYEGVSATNLEQNATMVGGENLQNLIFGIAINAMN